MKKLTGRSSAQSWRTGQIDMKVDKDRFNNC
jgi:hypothetical protein